MLHTPGVRAGPSPTSATRAVFLAAGLAMASWAPMVPPVQARLRLTEGALGGVLLSLGVGSLLAMPFSGGLAARFGCRAVILVAAGVAGLGLPLAVGAPGTPTLALGLALFGAGIGTVDATMNIHATLVERASGRAMMSGFHGLFSLGGIVGAGAVTGLLALRVPPLGAILLVVALAGAPLAAFSRGLRFSGSERGGPAFALPRGRVLLIGLMCAALFLAEGSVLDWSGVLLVSARGVARAQAGLGYVAFAAAMTLGRLTGDAVVRGLGGLRTLVGGSALAAFGFALAALAPGWPLTLAGYALVGLGGANAVPVLFSAAGRQSAMPSGLAVAAATTLGYGGLLAGPALIGFGRAGDEPPDRAPGRGGAPRGGGLCGASGGGGGDAPRP